MKLRLLIFLVGFGALDLLAAESEAESKSEGLHGLHVEFYRWPTFEYRKVTKWGLLDEFSVPENIRNNYLAMRQKVLNTLAIVRSKSASFKKEELSHEFKSIEGGVKFFINILDDESKRLWRYAFEEWASYYNNPADVQFRSCLTVFNRLYEAVSELMEGISKIKEKTEAESKSEGLHVEFHRWLKCFEGQKVTEWGLLDEFSVPENIRKNYLYMRQNVLNLLAIIKFKSAPLKKEEFSHEFKSIEDGVKFFINILDVESRRLWRYPFKGWTSYYNNPVDDQLRGAPMVFDRLYEAVSELMEGISKIKEKSD